jgi:amino acid transporter
MPYFAEFLLFLLPFLGFWLWRRYRPGDEPANRLVLAAVLGVLLMLAGAVWYGLSVSMRAHPDYVPAQLDASGRVIQGGEKPR